VRMSSLMAMRKGVMAVIGGLPILSCPSGRAEHEPGIH
jgi:hypothetical protein